MLQLIWPDELRPRRDELDELGELLGDHHDLSLLQDTLNDAPDSEREAARVALLIRRRMKKLERSALRLGARLFAQKPRAFCRSLSRSGTPES